MSKIQTLYTEKDEFKKGYLVLVSDSIPFLEQLPYFTNPCSLREIAISRNWTISNPISPISTLTQVKSF